MTKKSADGLMRRSFRYDFRYDLRHALRHDLADDMANRGLSNPRHGT